MVGYRGECTGGGRGHQGLSLALSRSLSLSCSLVLSLALSRSLSLSLSLSLSRFVLDKQRWGRAGFFLVSQINYKQTDQSRR